MNLLQICVFIIRYGYQQALRYMLSFLVDSTSSENRGDQKWNEEDA